MAYRWRRLIIKRKSKKRDTRLKTKLSLPDLEHAKVAVIVSLRSFESQRSYRHSIDEFVAWYCSTPRLSLNKSVVLRYRLHLEDRHLAAGTINVRLAAVRRLAYEAADSGLLSANLAAGIRRVKGVKKLGCRLGNWLSVEQARVLWQLPDPDTLKGKRDRAIVAVLLGCGLRRRELTELTTEHFQRREEHWAIVDLIGKGGHVRTVPVLTWVKQAVDDWLVAARVADGRLFRRVCRTGTIVGEEMTEKVVWHVVKQYAGKLGVSKLAPHDLRRSCARLCHNAGGELEQIQFLLGHVSVQTTEKYLGCKQRFREAVNEKIGIEPNR
ncbi:MAG TPA: tyrosine-type recombinase/integrase [Candidatus Dormibacteraeota bacterium]|nr:tyrosine-type recombinase/integrase [Candidatus Dormibacteraeota bacterium]